MQPLALLRISDVHHTILFCFVPQIGSYFGSVLTTLDVDKDSNTDILLVGAPMYMGTEKEEQGKVYVYALNQVMITLHLVEIREYLFLFFNFK